MKPEKKNIDTNIVLIVIGVLFLWFIWQDFSFTTNVNKSYSGALYAVEEGRLLEVESGSVQLSGKMNHSVRIGRRMDGSLELSLGGFGSAVPFMSSFVFYDQASKWSDAAVTAGLGEINPLSLGPYECASIFFSRNFNAIVLPLDCDGNRFYFLAAKSEKFLDEAEAFVLEVLPA